jgi:nucleotide-binding universal stress UspA family protein
VYKQILVPLDGSAFAEAALPLALALSAKTNSAIQLATVIEPIPAFAYVGWEPAAREWSEEYLAAVKDRISDAAGGPVTTALHSGHVVETLVDVVDAIDADVVVMATHGRGALSRAWLGSVADGFMRRSEVPLLVVRPEEAETPEPAPRGDFETILVPLDGTDLSESALALAVEFGDLFSCAYHLTRVVSYPIDIASPYLPHTVQMNQTMLADAKANAADYLEREADHMRKRGLRVTTSVVVDIQPGRGILSEADAVGCDLIAMATHGRKGVGRLVLGSAADKVLRGTHMPLLLYRPANVPAEQLA